MKILVVSNMYPDKKHPSAGIFVKKICDELKKTGVSCKLSVMYKSDGLFGKIKGYILFYASTFIKALFSKYDVAYIHYASHSSVPVLAAMHFKKITVYTNLHGSDVVPENKKQEKMQKYTRAILKKSEKVIVPSEYFKQLVSDKYSVAADKLYVYPSGGIDEKLFRKLPNDKISCLKEKFGLNTALPTFGMAGRLTYKKGWDTFLKAVRISVDNGVSANFIVAGSGYQQKDFLELRHELKLDEIVKHINLLPQEELAEFYNSLDFFVFPTEREGESLGLVAIEAMACGTPVIASNFAAPKYYVNKDNGFTFNKGNEIDLSKRIIEATEIYLSDKLDSLNQGAIVTAGKYSTDNIRHNLAQIIGICKN